MPTRSRRAAGGRAARRNRAAAFEAFLSSEAPAVEKIAVIRRGIRARVVAAMVDYLDVPKGVIFGVLRTPESTAHRLIKDNRSLDSAASERVVRVADIARLAEATFGGREAATRWLKTPNLSLRREMPLSLLDTELGAGEVRKVLSGITFGGTL